RQRELLEDAEHLQGSGALSIGRQLAHLPAAVRGVDGLDPFRLELGEVLRRHHATALPDHADDRFRRRALVEAIVTHRSDATERGRQRRIAEYFSGTRRSAADEERGP